MYKKPEINITNTVMSGSDFNSFFNRSTFVKLLRSGENHWGMQYKTGLNEDIVPFNPHGAYEPGGIGFIDEKDIDIWQNGQHFYIRKVKIPDNAQVYIENDSYKADKIILGKPKELKNDDQLCDIYVQKYSCYSPLRMISKKTFDQCAHYVKRNGLALEFVPDKFKTIDLCKMAILSNTFAIRFVPEQLLSREMYEYAVSSNGLALEFVPNYSELEENINEETRDINEWKLKLYKMAVSSNGLALGLIKAEYRTNELCELSVQNNGWALLYVPEQTKTICKLAAKQNHKMLDYVEKKFLTGGSWWKINEIYLAALKSYKKETKEKILKKAKKLK